MTPVEPRPVLLFASYAEAFGASQVQVGVPVEATVADIVAALRLLPGGAVLPAAPLVAVSRRYVRDPDAVVPSGAEIAVIPPVAGG